MVNVKYDKQNDVLTFFSLYHDIEQVMYTIMTKSNIKSLFIELTSTTISLHAVFLLELEIIMTYILEDDNLDRMGIDLDIIKETLEAITKIKNNFEKEVKVAIDYSTIEKEFKFKILDYQKVAFEEYETTKSKKHYRGYLLNAGTGTGKTFMSTALAIGLNSDLVIVIAPKNVASTVWAPELASDVGLFKKPAGVYYVHGESDNKLINTKNYLEEKFILCSYERLSEINNLDIKKYKKITVIVDEWHSFSERYSDRTKSLINVFDKVDPLNIILMSGTPIKASITELFNIIQILDKRFVDNPAALTRLMTLYRYPSSIINQTLLARYNEFTTVIKKKDIKLPSLVTKHVFIKLPNGDDFTLETIVKEMNKFVTSRIDELTIKLPYYNKVYSNLYTKARDLGLVNKIVQPIDYVKYEADFEMVQIYYKKNILVLYPDLIKRVNQFEKNVIMSELSKDEKLAFKEAATVIKYLLYKVRGEALANVILKTRIRAYSELASAIDYKYIVKSTKKKTIIFSSFIGVSTAAYDKLKKERFKPILVNGSTGNIGELVTTFKNDKSINPICTTYASLGTGTPLTEANIIIILDLPYRMYMYDQAIARAWRKGQDASVFVYIVRLDTDDKPNINDRNVDIISFFKEEVERITGYKFEVSIDDDSTNLVSTESMDYLRYSPEEVSAPITVYKKILAIGSY